MPQKQPLINRFALTDLCPFCTYDTFCYYSYSGQTHTHALSVFKCAFFT